MKKLSNILIFLSITLSGVKVSAQSTAVKPPMGWNSYNCYGSAVHEDEVKANTDYMAKYLKPHGWQYIVVDFLWSYDNPPVVTSAIPSNCGCLMVHTFPGSLWINGGDCCRSPINSRPRSVEKVSNR